MADTTQQNPLPDDADGTTTGRTPETEEIASDIEAAGGIDASADPEAALARPVAQADGDAALDMPDAPTAEAVPSEDEASSLLERLKDAASHAAERVQDAASAVSERVQEAAAPVIERVQEVASNTAESVVERAQDVATAAVDRVVDAAGAVRDRLVGDADGGTPDDASEAEQPAAEQAASEQPVAEQAASTEPVAQQDTAEQPAAEQRAPEQDGAEPAGQPVATEQPVAQQSTDDRGGNTPAALAPPMGGPREGGGQREGGRRRRIADQPTDERSPAERGEDRHSGDGANAPLGGYTGKEARETVKLEELDARELTTEKRAQRDLLNSLFEQSFTIVPEQDLVKGRIVTISDKDVVIDIGGKSDGIISRSEFGGAELAAGQDVEVFVERRENYQGQLVLSKSKADQVSRWRRIENAFTGEEILEGTIIRRIKGGMIVELFRTAEEAAGTGVEAFLPGSQIDVRPVRDFDAYLERRMEFKIVKLNEANQNIVVSHKALIERDLESQRETILQTMEPGQILEGVVKNVTDFGVFVDLGGVDGLLHITDLSWGRVQHPSEVVQIEQKLNVVVLDYDRDRQRISLGLKQLQAHPWDRIHDTYAIGQTVQGKVVSITDYGAFVELEKGIEGLVHISEMSWTEHVKHPSQVVSLGQNVEVKILNIDDDTKKISLGMKQLQPDPWEGIASRYPGGTRLNGKVRNITAFGVFVEIESGIDGLVHISDLSWTKKVRHPGEVVKKGQELDVIVLGIDEKNRRISLGHKQVETDPWTQFATIYAEGTDHDATIIRVHDRGLDVELPLEVEGFVPSTELAKIGHPADHYREGSKIEALRIIRFDRQNKEIVLSETAKDRVAQRSEREKEQDQKRQERSRERSEVADYQRTATSGPTTLGELSGLEALKARMEAEERGENPDGEA